MVLKTPALNKRSKVLSANKRIACYSNNGYYQVLSAESATKDGMSISGLIIDEIHQMKTRGLYDVFTKGSGDARQQPLFFIITTAGTNRESVCYELFLKAKDILAGKRVDPTFYPVIYALGDGEVDASPLRGRDCYAGLDLSSTSDITAFVLVFPPRTEEEKYIVLPRFWLPADTIPKRCRHDHVMYDVWATQGYIDVTPGNVIDYKYIQAAIEDALSTYHIIEIAYDPWNATMLANTLLDEGAPMVQHRQGFKEMSPSSKEVEKLLMEGKINHGSNPVLRWMAGNVVMSTDETKNIKPSKSKANEKIDGMVAMIMAVGRASLNRETSSVYDERGIITF